MKTIRNPILRGFFSRPGHRGVEDSEAAFPQLGLRVDEDALDARDFREVLHLLRGHALAEAGVMRVAGVKYAAEGPHR